MKQILTIILSASFLLACNSKKNDTTANADPVPVAEDHPGHEKVAEGLTLNNGAKWKADSNTLVHAALLQSIASNAAKERLADYLQTAAQFEDGLNKMISGCKMKGAGHDALHQWLEPLMEKTKALKNTASAEKGTAILHEIEKQVNLFPQYFEK